MRLIFDLETNGFLEKATQVHCATVLDFDTGKQWSYRSDLGGNFLDRLTADLDSADEIIGHNVLAFDVPMIQKFRPGWKPRAKVIDTLVLCKLVWPHIREIDFGTLKRRPGKFPPNMVGRQSLEAWGHRLNLHKGDYASVCKSNGIDPWASVNDDMVIYCEQDARVTAALYQRILSKQVDPRASELEHAVWRYCREQEANGVGFNDGAAVELSATLQARRSQLDSELRQRFGSWMRPVKLQSPKRSIRRWMEDPRGSEVRSVKGVRQVGYYIQFTEGAPYTAFEEVEFNPSSRDHIADRLMKVYGWQPEVFTDNGKPQVDEEVLKHLSFPESSTLLEYLLVDKRIGQISEGREAWLKCSRNGRIHGRIDTLGTVTGRCAHMQPNLGQVPAVGKPYGAECRSLFGSGYFVGADASGLELRMLAHYMAKYDGGSYAKVLLEGDIHWANTIALGLVPEGTIRDDSNPVHKKSRNIAKTFIYAFLYGAGDEKIGSIVGGGKKEGKALKAKFLASLPALKNLVDKVRFLAERDGYLPGLDGRRLFVRSSHAALNTLLQSAGALVMKLALVYWHEDMWAAGLKRNVDYKQVLWVHDEFQAECNTQQIAEECGQRMVNAIRRVEQGFNLRCPLDGEYKTGKNWKDTH